MNKKILFVLISAISLVCFLPPQGMIGKVKEEKEEAEFGRCKEELGKILKDDINLIAEQGEAYIGKEGEVSAGKKAKENARDNLSTALESAIEAKIIQKLGTKKMGHEDSFKRLVEERKNNLMENVVSRACRVSKEKVQAVVYVTKKVFEEQVDIYLVSTKKEVQRLAREGIEKLKEGSVVPALQKFIEARKLLFEFFGDLPVVDDLDGDETSEEITNFLNKKVEGLLTNLKIFGPDEKITYDVRGMISRRIEVKVKYLTERGEEDVPQVPLEVTYVTDEASIQQRSITTDLQGSAEIAIKRVNASYPGIILQVGLDARSLGISEKSVLPSPCNVYLERARTIAYSVNFFVGEKKTPTVDLTDEVKKIIVGNNFEIAECLLDSKDQNEEGIKAAARLNADYLLWIIAIASVRKYPERDLYVANVECRLGIYGLPEGSYITTFSTASSPDSLGFGVNTPGAVWNALSKIESELIKCVREKVQQLRKK